MTSFDELRAAYAAMPTSSAELLGQIATILRAATSPLSHEIYAPEYSAQLKDFLTRKVEAYSAAIADRTLLERAAAEWFKPDRRMPDPGELVCVSFGFHERSRQYKGVAYIDIASGGWRVLNMPTGKFVALAVPLEVIRWRYQPTYTPPLEDNA